MKRRQAFSLGTYGGPFLTHKFTLSPTQVNLHSHVIGASGSGKSTYLANYFLSLLEHGYPTTLIDPQGDLAHLIMRQLVGGGFFRNPHNYEKLMYLDIPAAEQAQQYLPFNLFKQNLPAHTITGNFKEAMHRAFPELATGAATFDTLLPRAVRVLLHHSLPITELERFLRDEQFRKQLLTTFDDKNVVDFFFGEYDQLRKSDQLNYAGSVKRRAVLLTDLPILKYSFGQPDNILQLRSLMDAGTSMIINLDLPDKEAAQLLGCLLMVGFEQAAESRRDLFSEERVTHHLIVDEFPDFTAKSEGSVNRMLSATRKYGLFITLAHQTWSQLPPALRGSLQNVGLEVMFRQGRDDAEVSAKIIGQVETKTVRYDGEDQEIHESEMRSMHDQWEDWIKELQHLKVGQAYIKRFFHHASWIQRNLFKTDGTEALKITTHPIRDVLVDPQEWQEIKKEYLHRYFRPAPQISTPQALQGTILPRQKLRREFITE